MFKGYRMMEKLFLAMVYSEYPWLEAAPLLLVEHRQFENPEKKHTEHWIEMAPSDFRSKVADWSDTIMSSPADGVVTLINTRRHHNHAAPSSPSLVSNSILFW